MCVFDLFHIIKLKGVYNDKEDVAVKVFMNVAAFEKEMAIYNALNAVKDKNIEDHHIPRIYYYGKFLGVTHAIAMSRFEGTLNDYCERNNKSLSDADILDILLQTVCVHLNFNLNIKEHYLLIIN